jgi:hypothetical protein
MTCRARNDLGQGGDMFKLRVLISTCVLALIVIGMKQPAYAETLYTYNYTGGTFDTFSRGNVNSCPPECEITGSMTFSQLLPILTETIIFGTSYPFLVSLSFTDGVYTITQSNATSATFGITATGALIEGWAITVSDDNYFNAPFPEPGFNVSLTTDSADCTDSTVNSLGGSSGPCGTWSEPVVTNTTPLPAALPLFAGGLGALSLLGWRRKRKNGAATAA